MSLKSQLAKFTAQSAHFVLHDVLKRGGTSLPGKLAVSIDPDVLSAIATDFDLVVVTGTNGKTLTTALITRILKAGGYSVITNPSGSNMVQGIAGTLLTTKITPSPNGKKPIAVLEVDEANVLSLAKAIQPKYFVLTNIFRDQMDRYGEIYTTYQKIIDGILQAPDATVITNGDSPIFARGDYPNKRLYYGFDNVKESDYKDLKAPNNTDGILSPTDHSVLHYHFITYANLGRYFSVTDDFKRPHLDTAVTAIDELTPKSSRFAIDGQPLKMEIGGLYNIYNALAAYSVGKAFDVTPAQMAAAFDEDKQVFGRQESLKIGNKDLTILLIKNPVGTNTVIDMMETEPAPVTLIAMLNANYADGIDTSWIWDAEFERLHDSQLKAVMTGGERYKDITVRLKMAGFPIQETFPKTEEIVQAIEAAPTDKVYLAATYTAMLQVRAVLREKGYIKEEY
ncbi:Mur ligase family protein [Fructobacillus fructosus]|uniref:Mur ligase family protein n=1 Tax=Fructobacillus fructosus TaxID=1631 RepID=UPI002D83E7AE|nr:UDP-N-acetylmuramyl pentapeptide synthase (MurF) [Fructobacillus fructosus]CAK1250171.1 UDP-N-acetylmuramyl pentapeptide synthase (MurF) [Fructobacillus fructosus]CAK1250606.1 UDP-N-acetylmuramyl pentapeptide synthase (MurF) [Fructobacillus fructosus]